MSIEERAIENMEKMTLGEYDERECYILGATEQMQIDIEKACEWLEKWSDAFASDYGMNDSFVKEFRKAMEDA